MRRVHVTTAAATAAALSLSLLAVPAQAAPDRVNKKRGLVCNGDTAPTFGSATKNTAQNTKFTSYGNDNSRTDDWTGADTTYSLKLSDGRVVYAYSDTFLGAVTSDGERSPVIESGGTTPFLNNTFVVEEPDGDMTTVHRGPYSDPVEPMPPAEAHHWFWAGDLIQNGGEVQQIYREYWDPNPDNGDPWDLEWTRNVVARFPTADLDTPTQVVDVPSSRGIQWGSALNKSGSYTYIYGTEDVDNGDSKTKYMHVARVLGSDLRGTWEYRNSKGKFVTGEANSARGLAGVSNEYSVTQRGEFFILVNQDTKQAFSTEIDTYVSCSAGGPFTQETTVYNTPETGLTGTYKNQNVYTYNAHVHLPLSNYGSFVVSYNVNSLEPTDHYNDVSIYRARYIDVPVYGGW